MPPSTITKPPSASPKPRWSRCRVAILLGLCVIGGCISWRCWLLNRSSDWSTVIVIVRNDVDQQPVPGVDVQFHDLNYGMPVLVPNWISQRNSFHRWENPVTTDSLGKATVRIPKHVRPHERIRFGIGVNMLTIPVGLAYRTQEGRLFDDDPIVVWLKPTPNAELTNPSRPLANPTPAD